MIGGSCDVYSKTVVAVRDQPPELFIWDPHYSACDGEGSPSAYPGDTGTHFSHMSHTPFPHISEFNSFLQLIPTLTAPIPPRIHSPCARYGKEGGLRGGRSPS